MRAAYFRRSGRLRLEAAFRVPRDPLSAVLTREFGWPRREVRARLVVCVYAHEGVCISWLVPVA